jgi:3-isopropylmalate dehydratase small subunit
MFDLLNAEIFYYNKLNWVVLATSRQTDKYNSTTRGGQNRGKKRHVLFEKAMINSIVQEIRKKIIKFFRDVF